MTAERTRVLTAARLALAALTLGTTAHAADLCLSYSVGAVLGVTTHYRTTLKAFRVPSRGRCKPIDGWHRVGIGAVPGPTASPDAFVSGNACTSSDGSTLNLSWNEIYMASSPAAIRVVLPLPLGASGVLTASRAGSVYGSTNLAPIPCDDYAILP